MKALLRQGFFISIITEDLALKRTTNYALPTWEKSDFIQMSDFNDLTQKTDAALKANADAIGEKAAAAAVEKFDKQREKYYSHYTGRPWGLPENYDLCVNSARLGIDRTSALLAQHCRELFQTL